MSVSDPPSVVWDSDLVFQLEQIQVVTAMICLGYGCFVTLAILALQVLLRRGLVTFAQRALLVAVLVFVISSTINFASEYAFETANIIAGPGPYVDDQSVFDLATRVNVLNMIFTRIIYLLNDVLVVWRAWVLADHWTLRMVLAIFLLVATGCTFAEGGLQIKAGIFDFISPAQHLLLFVPLLFNNLFATTVVLYKTWVYRTEIKKDLYQTRPKSQVESVLFLLIESGLIYSAFWILWIICQYVSVPPMLLTIVTAASPFVSAIYPMLIILIVENQKSRASQGAEKPFSQPLEFSPQLSTSQTQFTSNQAISVIQSIVDIQSGRSTQRRCSVQAEENVNEKDLEPPTQN